MGARRKSTSSSSAAAAGGAVRVASSSNERGAVRPRPLPAALQSADASRKQRWVRKALNQWWRRRSRASRFAMKALGASVLLAVILNLYLGSGYGQQQQQRSRGRQGPQVSWRDAKDDHLSLAPLVNEGKDLSYFADSLSTVRDFRQHIDALLIPRVSGTEGNLKVRKYISDVMRGANWTVEHVNHTQPTPVGDVEFVNVVATLDPRAPRRLVLACHYDSKLTPGESASYAQIAIDYVSRAITHAYQRLFIRQTDGQEGFLGATDSAVPCAQMLNLAHAMDRNLKLDREGDNQVTLQFIFFDGEEAFVRWTRDDSTYGSRHLAEKWESKDFEHRGIKGNHLHRMDVMVLLDLIGAQNPKFLSTQPSTQKLFNRMARIEQELRRSGSIQGRGQIFQDGKHYGANVEDDHIPFLERGVPILHLIVLPFPRVWHTAADNRSAIHMRDTEKINKILRVFVAEYLQLTRPDLQRSI